MISIPGPVSLRIWDGKTGECKGCFVSGIAIGCYKFREWKSSSRLVYNYEAERLCFGVVLEKGDEKFGY